MRFVCDAISKANVSFLSVARQLHVSDTAAQIHTASVTVGSCESFVAVNAAKGQLILFHSVRCFGTRYVATMRHWLTLRQRLQQYLWRSVCL